MPASVSATQKRLEKLDPSDDKYPPLLRQLLSHKGLKQHIQGLHGSGLEEFIELLDKALSHTHVNDELFRKTLRRLQSTCSNRGVLPRSHIIQSERLSKRGQAIASGGFADAHEAKLDGEKVCIKVLRQYVQDTEGITKKMFYKEVVVWKRLQHPNIVPFLGVPAMVPPFEIVCDWMENARITEYVRKNPEVDRVDLLWDVADGLHYLHSCNIIHGDLKGANVLIDKGGHARLTDFGLTSVIRGEKSLLSPQDPSVTNTTTWAAPEILSGGPVSKEGDIFTFAMVAVETFTGKPPFVLNFHAAMLEILNGKRPQRPVTLHHEELWETMNGCWSKEPKERPTTSQLLEFFRKSFPGKREMPEAQPLPGVSSTWTLVTTEGDVDGNPGPRPDPSRQGTVDGNAPGPEDPGAVDAQVGELKPRDQPDPPIQGPTTRSVNPSPRTEDKPPLLKRAVRKVKRNWKKLFENRLSRRRGTEVE